MKNKKSSNAKKIAREIGKLYDEMFESASLEELVPLFRAEIRVARDARKHNMGWALNDENFAALEKAVKEFEAIYAAEKAEAEKMPLSRYEAVRVKKMIDEATDFQPLLKTPREH